MSRTPWWCGWLPVKTVTIEGSVRGRAAIARDLIVPVRASRSRCGVIPRGSPADPRWSALIVSIVRRRRFGRSGGPGAGRPTRHPGASRRSTTARLRRGGAVGIRRPTTQPTSCPPAAPISRARVPPSATAAIELSTTPAPASPDSQNVTDVPIPSVHPKGDAQPSPGIARRAPTVRPATVPAPARIETSRTGDASGAGPPECRTIWTTPRRPPASAPEAPDASQRARPDRGGGPADVSGTSP